MARTCIFRLAVSILCAALLAPVSTFAASPKHETQNGAQENGWKATVAPHSLIPPQVVAVDKNRQSLFVFERRSPLRLTDQYTCTTGQALGDKEVRGDLKTPEGIYFVVQRLGSGLDFTKYGNEAYTLNYPNPVDKLRKKTGYGIWIHGRGTTIVPRETQGCVALNNGDIAVLGKKLAPGTPVAVASTIVQGTDLPTQEKNALTVLEKRTHAWAKAWTSRSQSFFDYYDPAAYSIAQGESFDKFRAQKAGLFKALPWIDTKINNVQVLQGPGYWVSWFQQDYKAPNLSTKGVRRLYWQKDKKGELRIVGMEWAPHLSGTLTAGLGEAAIPPVEASPRSEEDTPPAAKKTTEQPKVPVARPESQPVHVATAPVEAAKPQTPAVSIKPPAKKESDAEHLERLATQGAAFVEQWRKAWQSADIKAYMQCYGKGAVQGKNRGSDAIRAHKVATWKAAKPSKVKLANVRISVEGDSIKVDMIQEYSDYKKYSDKGIKTLRIKQYGSAWRIIQEDWSPEN